MHLPVHAQRLAGLCGAIVLALTACSAGSADERDDRSTPTGGSAQTARSHLAEAASLCDSSGIRCGTAGPADVPYALVAAAGTEQPRGPLVLVEPGGPGLDLPAAVEAASSLLGDRAVDYLVVGEPWTAGAPSEGCLRVVEERLARLGSAASSPSDACEQSWWRPGERAQTLRDVQDQLSRDVSLVVAASFGAVAAADGASALPQVPVLLLTPAAVPGTPLGAVLAARAAAVPAAVAAGPSRSEAGADAVLASMAAAYSSESHEQTVELLSSWPELDQDARDQLRRAAFAATYRFGDGSVLPNQVGYLDGFCAAYPVAGSAAPAGFAERVLTDAHPCPRGDRDVVPAAPLATSRGCLLIDELDLVTPVAWGRTWAARAPGLQVTTYRSGAHGTPPPVFGRALTNLLEGRPCYDGA